MSKNRDLAENLRGALLEIRYINMKDYNSIVVVSLDELKEASALAIQAKGNILGV